MALSEVDEIIGALFSLVPTRIRLKTEDSLQELLRTTQNTLVAATPYEPFGIQALQQHFGHRRYHQSLFIYEPPRPASFSASTTVEEKSGVHSRLRAAEELNTQTRLPCGFCLVLTPRGDDLHIWARYDENFLDGAQARSIVEEFIQTLNQMLTSKHNCGYVIDCSEIERWQSHGRAPMLGRFAHIWPHYRRQPQLQQERLRNQTEKVNRNSGRTGIQ